MARIVPEYSRRKVDEAGAIVADEEATPQNHAAALPIVHNWRSSHSFPLNTFTVTLKKKALLVDPEADVVQRLKRLASINYKLRRFQGYRLSQIQDIGGCRAVVQSVALVKELVDRYKASDLKHDLVKVDDYLAEPQLSGYRSVHLIYRYKSDKSEIYNGLKIEMQIRSLLQHAWATAVETVGTFIKEALKSSVGEEDWLRFFKLMGSVIAHEEGTAFVHDTPLDYGELIDELRRYADKLDVMARLRAYSEALKYVEEPGAQVDTLYYLLNFDALHQTIDVQAFSKRQLYDALDAYEDAEQRASSSDVVLVSAGSVNALQRAYPNYFADTRVFIGLLEDALDGKRLEADDPEPLRAG